MTAAPFEFADFEEFSYPVVGLTTADYSLRAGRITASIAAMVCEESAHGTPLRAYRIVRGLENWSGNRSTAIGNLTQPMSAALYQMRHPGVRLFEPGTRVHPELDWLAATVDYLALHPDGRIVVLECKYTDDRNRDTYGMVGSAEVPPEGRLQVAVQLAVWRHFLPIDRGEFAVTVGGPGDFREYVVEYNAEFEANTIAVLERFRRDHLLPRIPPKERSRTYVNTVWPVPTADIRDAGEEPETIACAADVKRLAGERARIEHEYELACADLCEQIGSSEGVQIDKDKITWKNEARAKGRVLRIPPRWRRLDGAKENGNGESATE